MARTFPPHAHLAIALTIGHAGIWNAACVSAATEHTGAERIVSFAPSNTELIYATGGGSKIVGVCSYCDYPIDVKHKTIVGNFVSANLERIARIKPDKVLLVNGQEGLAGMLEHSGYQVQIVKNRHLSDISANVRVLSSLTGNTASGERVAQSFDNCLQELSKIIGKSPSPAKVFYCVWPAPLLTIGKGSYLTDVITACGGTSISSSLSADYPHFSIERLMLANPDVIVMPYEVKDHSFLNKHPWVTLKAVKNNRVYFLPEPKEDGLARPTLRLTKGLLWLSEKIQPQLSGELQNWYGRAEKALNTTTPSLTSTPQ